MDISLQQVEYRYQANTPFERLALQNVSFDIPEGTYLAIIGHTGSGKSTVLQHLNALLKPTSGKVVIGDSEIRAGEKQKDLKKIRQRVGIVFQFPEHQLFEETIEKDICFGPMNFGVSEEEAKKRAREALIQVGLSEDFLQRSPFDLSGGQMRRVAIAGVLAMKPDVIVLDEPTAGLDPRGRKEIMIMHSGEVYQKGTPEEIFASPEALMQMGLDVPDVIRFQKQFEEKFHTKLSRICLTTEQLAEAVAESLKRGVPK